jgi:cytidylate kinase
LNKKINIAVDGYSSCGKGTLAKALAKNLDYIFIDSGAMYRAVTYAMLQKGITVDDLPNIIGILPDLHITFKNNPKKDYYHTLLNGVDIEDEIRTMEVNEMVSPVSKIREVRAYLVQQQKRLGVEKGVVMDGRDIGTVVFPDAELKIFMTADAEIRAQRRYSELQQKGNTQISYAEILENLNDRDLQDSTRANSPLKAASDAVIIDNSHLSREEQNELALKLALEKIGRRG